MCFIFNKFFKLFFQSNFHFFKHSSHKLIFHFNYTVSLTLCNCWSNIYSALVFLRNAKEQITSSQGRDYVRGLQ